MTAEIVIMNRSAVALAADSAVTVRSEDSRGKVFNTANKVFSLSKYAPVGIMISGSASVRERFITHVTNIILHNIFDNFFTRQISYKRIGNNRNMTI